MNLRQLVYGCGFDLFLSWLTPLLAQHISRYAVDVNSRIAGSDFFAFYELASDSIKCFISAVLRGQTPASLKHLREAAVQANILLRRAVAIRVEPIEKRMKSGILRC